MSAVALHNKLWEKEPPLIPKPRSRRTKCGPSSRSVKDELAKDHAKPDALVRGGTRAISMRCARSSRSTISSGCRRARRSRFEPMPAFKRGSSAAEYLAPGVLDHKASLAGDILR